MLKLNEQLESNKEVLKGNFTLEAKSKCGNYYKVRNHRDNSDFPMKVETFVQKAQKEEYVLHDDDSFDIKGMKESTNIEWS